MKARIYVCHTFYHVYISFLKELNLPKEQRGKATLVISKMSCDFGGFPEHIRKMQFFEEVVEFDEKPETYFPKLAKYRKNRGNLIANMWNRILFTKKLAKLEEAYIPVDFKQYKDIYVYCDSDPIGYYLNWKKIWYHAMEDGLNCLKNGDLAHYDNMRHFGLKAFLSQRLGLIFIQNGYGKYCIDMEVNDISAIRIPFEKYVEVSRNWLFQQLDEEGKELILQAFVEDIGKLNSIVRNTDRKKMLLLTEPLCDLQQRERIFSDIVSEYEKDYEVVLKPHPRDELDYHKVFPKLCIIEKTVPMEMLNFFQEQRFDLVVSVFTELGAVCFADEKLRLGPDFMDDYEEPAIHRVAEILQAEYVVKEEMKGR